MFDELGSEVSRESESWQAAAHGESGVTCNARIAKGAKRQERMSDRGAIGRVANLGDIDHTAAKSLGPAFQYCGQLMKSRLVQRAGRYANEYIEKNVCITR